jgi:dTDP-4-amino-4,6-dideoxygalactose transaminase
MSYRIPLSYNPIDQQALADVLSRYTDRSHAEIITDFEKTIIATTGAKYVLAVNSGTAAIHLALQILGVGQGDEVLAPTSTYIATINPILYQGALPILIDSEPDTWNIDPELAERAIKSRSVRPKAMIVVHSYGNPAKMDDLLFLSSKYDIPLIEDAAESLGSSYKGKPLGTFGQAGVLSFNNNKIITTYGGGALLTNDEKLYRRAALLASQARENKPYYEHHQTGYNYRMGVLNAACGLAQWPSLSQQVAGRKALKEMYLEATGDFGEVQFMQAPVDGVTNNWLITALVSNPEKDYLTYVKPKFEMNGIETRPVWNPMHRQPMLSDVPTYLSGVADDIFRQGLCLPSSISLSKENIWFICQNMINSLG